MTKRPCSSDKYIIALTGGISSGKSLVSDTLKNLGAKIIDTDILARRVVKPGSELLQRIRLEWGDKILHEDGSLNRKRLGSIIFQSREDRRVLNEIMHPPIRKLMHEEITKSNDKIIVIVIPLLFESDEPTYYNEVWVVNMERKKQEELLMKRDNVNLESARNRIFSQMPLEEKVEKADIIIDNSREIEHTRQIVKEEWGRLLKRLKIF